MIPTLSHPAVNAVVIKGIVYYGAIHTICCYDPLQDKWATPLTPPPVTHFGLGQIKGKLVIVGGDNKRHEATNEVYMYEENLKIRKWKQIFPPMSTARSSPGVLSLQSALSYSGGWNVAVQQVYGNS